MVLAAGAVGATGTFAWFQASAPTVTASNATAVTKVTGAASVGDVTIDVAITYDANNLMYTDTSGNAKIWNANNELVDATYGVKYTVCTVAISEHAETNYSQMGSATYYLTIANNEARVRLGPDSGTYVGADADQVAAFSFDNKATFATKSTTFRLALTPEFSATSYSASQIDDSFTVGTSSWSFTAATSGSATLTAFADVD